jgi:hypothetical protein
MFDVQEMEKEKKGGGAEVCQLSKEVLPLQIHVN